MHRYCEVVGGQKCGIAYVDNLPTLYPIPWLQFTLRLRVLISM